jgi:hypothetical protein
MTYHWTQQLNEVCSFDTVGAWFGRHGENTAITRLMVKMPHRITLKCSKLPP